MTSDSRPTMATPTPVNAPADEATKTPGSDETTAPALSGASPVPHPHRTRQIVSVVLILAGFILLIVTLRAQNLGLAPTEGASWTQVTTGVLGTILLVGGLALIVQAFEVSDEPPGVE